MPIYKYTSGKTVEFLTKGVFNVIRKLLVGASKKVDRPTQEDADTQVLQNILTLRDWFHAHEDTPKGTVGYYPELWDILFTIAFSKGRDAYWVNRGILLLKKAQELEWPEPNELKMTYWRE